MTMDRTTKGREWNNPNNQDKEKKKIIKKRRMAVKSRCVSSLPSSLFFSPSLHHHPSLVFSLVCKEGWKQVWQRVSIHRKYKQPQVSLLLSLDPSSLVLSRLSSLSSSSLSSSSLSSSTTCLILWSYSQVFFPFFSTHSFIPRWVRFIQIQSHHQRLFFNLFSLHPIFSVFYSRCHHLLHPVLL